MLHRLCIQAGLSPELEKPDLLRARPLVGSTHEDGSISIPQGEDNSEQRRPADVYVPRWRLGVPAAIDLAVTSGLRNDCLGMSAPDPKLSLKRYEDFKCSYLDTRQRCTDEGITFIPLIMEAVGGSLGAQGHRIIAELAKASASASGEQMCHFDTADFIGHTAQGKRSGHLTPTLIGFN